MESDRCRSLEKGENFRSDSVDLCLPLNDNERSEDLNLLGIGPSWFAFALRRTQPRDLAKMKRPQQDFFNRWSNYFALPFYGASGAQITDLAINLWAFNARS